MLFKVSQKEAVCVCEGWGVGGGGWGLEGLNESLHFVKFGGPLKEGSKVLSEKNGHKSIKTALLLSNVIDADYQNSC